MLLLKIEHSAEVDFFSSKKSEAFFREILNLPVLSVSREKAWTKIILGPDDIGGTTQVIGRMLEKDPGGLLAEKDSVSRKGEKKNFWLPQINGPTAFYCLGVKKGETFSLYDFNILRSVLIERRGERGVLQSSQAVVWEGEKIPPYIINGFVFDRDVIRTLMEEAAAEEILIHPEPAKLVFDDSLF